MYKKAPFLLFFIFSLSSINAQKESIFFKIDVNNGLSNNRIPAITQTKNKFVWIASFDGLNRYDGTKNRIYNIYNSNIASNLIHDISIENNNDLWLATSKGLCYYNFKEDVFETYYNNEEKTTNDNLNKINSILNDGSEALWITNKLGVSKFDKLSKKFINYKLISNTDKIFVRDARAIVKDNNNDIYVGTFGGGVFKLNKSTQIFESLPSSKYLDKYIHDIQVLKNNKILLATNGAGVLVYDTLNQSFEKLLGNLIPFEQEVPVVRDLYIDKQENLWLGTDGNGVLKIQNFYGKESEIVNYRHIPERDSSLSGDAVYAIFQDVDNNYWIGTAWKGVCYLKKDKNFDFFFSDIIGHKTASVLSVLKSNNTLYLGLNAKGLTQYDILSNKIKSFTGKQQKWFDALTIQCIHQQNNILWLGTYANGLIQYNLKKQTLYAYKANVKTKNSITYNNVKDIVEDSKGNLWIATGGGGLNYFDIERAVFTSYKHDDKSPYSLSSNSLTSLQLKGNNLWVATADGGVNLFDLVTHKAKQYRYDKYDSNTISSDNITSIYMDSKDNLWVGTFGAGINRINFDDHKVDRFGDNNKLSKESIMSIIEDNDHNIWFSTYTNIFNYNTNTQAIKLYNDLNGEFHSSVFKDSRGWLYYGNNVGLLKFNPRKINKTQQISTVLITDFKLFNKPLKIGGQILDTNIVDKKNIVLDHDQDVITFEFSTLNFPTSKNFEYSIQMEKFDKDWRNIGADNKVTYTNLSPGNYTFKVKSRIPGNIWSDEFTAVNLTINKPFWLQWWAIAIYILVVIFLFYIFKKYISAWEKIKSNLELEKLSREKDAELSNIKQQFFTNISHEIRTPVTLILSSISALLKEESFIEKKQLNPINTIQKNSNQLLNLVNKLLDSRKLETSSQSLKVSESNWVEFCYEIFLSFKELANQRNINLEFHCDQSVIMLWFDKSQMEKVIYNLLSNALKFTDDGKEIMLSITLNDTSVLTELKDQGVGIAEKHLSKIFNRYYQPDIEQRTYGTGFGLGLSITKEIIELHKGSIEVKSSIGKGTTFLVKLSKGSSHFSRESVLFEDNQEDLLENYVSKNFNKQEDVLAASNKLDDSRLSDKDTSILVVEDNEDIREYIISLINRNYTVIEAPNGKVGLEITKKQLPDLIISDVMMPLMDGIEMSQRIKSNVNTGHIPIILLTARTSLIHHQEGYSIGAEDYITKPFNEVILLSKIQSILKNRHILKERLSQDEMVVPSELTLNEYDQNLLENLIQLIEDNIESEELNSKLITQELGVSHSVIYKKIKAFTGLSLIEFITEIKLKTAKKLILEKDYTVVDACYKVGYSNRKYFSKLFKKRFGKNPSEYRRQRKEMIQHSDLKKKNDII